MGDNLLPITYHDPKAYLVNNQQQPVRSMPPGFTRNTNPDLRWTQMTIPWFNPTTGETWTAPDGSYIPPAGWQQNIPGGPRLDRDRGRD